MAIPFFTNIDLKQNQLTNALLQILGSDPGSPAEGQVWYRSDLHLMRLRLASSTISLGSGTGTVTSVTAGDSTITVGGTATDPTISVNSITHTKVSDFDTQVHTSSLDQMTAPAANVSWNSKKITNLADPTSAQDAATKNYVDVLAQGLVIKPSALYATTAALPACTYANGASGVGATLTGNSNGALAAQDGQTPAANDLILVKNQASGLQNGLYVVTTVGTGSVPFVLTRHVDMDTSAEFSGAFIPIINGTANNGSLWLCNNSSAPTVGTTAITFIELNKATDLNPTAPIAISGNTISLNIGAGLTTSGSNLVATGPQKYSVLIGDGSSTAIVVTHNLGTRDVVMSVQDASSFAIVYCDMAATTTNTATFTFAVAPASNAYKVTIIG